MQPHMPMTKEEFWSKYWFTPMQLVTLINPKADDCMFMVEGRHFTIKAGATEQMPGTVANIYLNHMTRIMAQDDDRLELMSDFNLMKIYFDKLIVNVKDMMQETDNTPAYLRDLPEHMRAEEPELPPWQQDKAPKTPEVKEEAKPKTSEFTHDGVTYRMVVGKNDKTMYYKNGKLTSAAEYSKVASML